METKAPIICLMPYEEDGKTNVVGSFTCTPIVKYPVESMTPDAKVKGVTVLELGQGNTPRSMFTYEKGGKKFILVSVARNNKMPAFGFPSAYWVARVDADMLKETTDVNEKAPWRIGGKGPKAGDRVDRGRPNTSAPIKWRSTTPPAPSSSAKKRAASAACLPLP